MSGVINTPESMEFTGNVLENWRYFKVQWDSYKVRLKAEKTDIKEEVLVATLMSCMGRQCYRIFSNLNINSEDKKDSSRIIENLDKYFEPKVNKWFERYMFITSKQKDGELFVDYLNRLTHWLVRVNLGISWMII